MKNIATTLLTLSGLFIAAFANPVPADSSGCNIDDIFAQIESHTSAIVSACENANIDASASIDVRTQVASSLSADFQAIDSLLAQASAAISASTQAGVLGANSGCDAGCIEQTCVKHTKDFCNSIEIVIQILGEDCTKQYIQPCFQAWGQFTTCLDGIFAGIAASVSAAIQSTLSASVIADLGLNLNLGLGLGGILGIGL